ncbi:VRR-NUC domain-containing protein [Marinimicrobium sp. C2-29]|uniref:VRR-NUC domain-containing protein n=1 Tax=Marinimicrobium sp. C2-29 TaxID=3139825 RepID=UPI0031386830
MNSAANSPDHPASSGSGPASLDDPFYYRHNFRWVLDWVITRYDDLLTAPERQFVTDFGRLPRASQALLVRMVMRKGQLFRADRLRYPEIGSSEAAARPLIELGWLNDHFNLTLEQLFAQFTWPELKIRLADALQAPGLSPRLGKRDSLAQLAVHYPHARPLSEWGIEGAGLYELTIMPLANRFRWLFFGNPYQDWSEFVLTELGLFQYEPVVFDQASRPVHTTRELQTYWHLQQCREQLYQDEPLEVVAAQIPAIDSTTNPLLIRTRERLFYRLGREWERAGELERALWAYTGCHYPGARGRQLRVLERLTRYPEAFDLAREAARKPETEAEAQQLSRLLPRLHRKLALTPPATAKPPEPPRLDLVLPLSVPVEVAVLSQLQEPKGPVHYVENTLITGLFGLLFWEAIFAPLTGAFFHPFQRGPADLYWPDFHSRRKSLFDEGFERLARGEHGGTILQNYREKWGIQSPFVNWGILSETLITQALACIPAHHLILCFERLLRDIKANRAGLPDLIQFWPEEGRYRMIEVKGPGDRLQDNQKRWLAFFAEHGMPVTVGYVSWSDVAGGDEPGGADA